MGMRDIRGKAGSSWIDLLASALGGLHVAQSGSRFEEAVNRGNVYLTANQTTVTTQAGLSATTPALTIANRVGSGKIVKIWYAGATGLVVAAAAAEIWACLGGYSATAVTETTVAIVRNAKTGDTSAPTGIGVCAVATLPAAPVAIANLGSQTLAAVTVALDRYPFGRWWDGALWIQPGYNFSIQTSTATSLFCDYIFEVQNA